MKFTIQNGIYDEWWDVFKHIHIHIYIYIYSSDTIINGCVQTESFCLKLHTADGIGNVGQKDACVEIVEKITERKLALGENFEIS